MLQRERQVVKNKTEGTCVEAVVDVMSLIPLQVDAARLLVLVRDQRHI